MYEVTIVPVEGFGFLIQSQAGYWHNGKQRWVSAKPSAIDAFFSTKKQVVQRAKINGWNVKES